MEETLSLKQNCRRSAAARQVRALGLARKPVNLWECGAYPMLVHASIHASICVPCEEVAESACSGGKRRPKRGGRLPDSSGSSRVITARPQDVVGAALRPGGHSQQ